MIEIRKPEERDRDAIAALHRLSFNIPAGWQERMLQTFGIDQFLCAYEGDRLIATTRTIPFKQWFGGRDIPCAGVASVATVPERRGRGVASLLMRELLRGARHEGAVISTLYPATVPLYRSLGYEYAGTYTEYRAPVPELPPAEAEVEELGERDLEGVKECFRR